MHWPLRRGCRRNGLHALMWWALHGGGSTSIGESWRASAPPRLALTNVRACGYSTGPLVLTSKPPPPAWDHAPPRHGRTCSSASSRRARRSPTARHTPRRTPRSKPPSTLTAPACLPLRGRRRDAPTPGRAAGAWPTRPRQRPPAAVACLCGFTQSPTLPRGGCGTSSSLPTPSRNNPFTITPLAKRTPVARRTAPHVGPPSPAAPPRACGRRATRLLAYVCRVTRDGIRHGLQHAPALSTYTRFFPCRGSLPHQPMPRPWPGRPLPPVPFGSTPLPRPARAHRCCAPML